MKRLRRLSECVLTTLLLAVPGAQATEPVNLRDGLWRLSVEMIVPGRGPETGPLTQDMCLKPSEVGRLAVPPNSPCQVSGLDIQPLRMRWKVSCEQGQMRSRGEGIMEFGGKRLTSALLIETDPPYAMRIKQSMTGTYLGPCPAGMAAGKTPLKPYTD
jgi:hypothetical protein